MPLPRLVVTGASGFIGRHLLEVVRSRYQVIALGRRSQAEAGVPPHENITWHQVDIGDCEPLTALFHDIRDSGGADLLVHLAAHYDFTGDEHPEYWRTNVEGLRNVLDLSRLLKLRCFVFASSAAACPFPPRGKFIDESTPPLGEHVYSVTKRLGEEMLAEYKDSFKSVIVRFAALFNDWCEYPPLFVFLDTWLSSQWNARMLGGRGESAIPYMHVRDSSIFLSAVLEKADELMQGEVLLASTSGSVSHRELFEASTAYYFGTTRRPIRMPKLLCGPGMWGRDVLGRLLGERPFERPWMARYIDLKLEIDASRSYERLGWRPRPRLDVLRRIPFLIENLRADPIEWYRRNREAMKVVELRPNLRIHRALEQREPEISQAFTRALVGPEATSYQSIPPEDHEWHHRLILRALLNAIRTREKGVFMAYCRDLAERRFKQGFGVEEVSFALATLNDICLKFLHLDSELVPLKQSIHDNVTSTIQFGIDQVQETYELLQAGSTETASSRLEQQFWSRHEERLAQPPAATNPTPKEHD